MPDFSDFLEVQTRSAWGRTLADLVDWCSAPAPGSLTLDAGCGPGLFPALLKTRYRVQAIGLDLDLGLLRSAPTLLPLAQAAAQALPFAASSFSLVTAANLVFLLPQPLAALREFRRVLQPGGELILLNPSELLTVQAAQMLADSRGLEGKNRASLLAWAANAEKFGGWSEETAQNLLAAAGFFLRESVLRVGPGFARLVRAG